MYVNRRQMLQTAGLGFGSWGLSHLLQRDGLLASEPSNPLAARPPHYRPRAKNVIFLFMFGGPSSVDLFDPKPTLDRYDGRALPNYNADDAFFASSTAKALKSPFTFRKHGQCGLDVSDRFPHLARHADELCVIRSMYAENANHRPAILQMNTGFLSAGKPSFGSWVTYGLGSESENLPAYVVVLDAIGAPFGGALNWGSGFLPASYQGTIFRPTGEPIANLNRPAGLTAEQQRARLDYLGWLNERHLQQNPAEGPLAARIASYELAYRMQIHASNAVDLQQETAATQSLYGMDVPHSSVFGRNCLLARRLVERGVRFIQLYSGGGGAMGSAGWDSHSNLRGNHIDLCRRVDQPIAGLLTDLKQRGLLDETLVIWGGEFGRLPTSQGADGRDHNIRGFTMWLAGGGSRPGTIYGATDDFGYHAVENRMSIHDLHATCLHLLGLDHLRLTYRYQGRDFRITDVHGEVHQGVLA